MTHYGKEFKEQLVRKMMPPNAAAAPERCGACRSAESGALERGE